MIDHLYSLKRLVGKAPGARSDVLRTILLEGAAQHGWPYQKVGTTFLVPSETARLILEHYRTRHLPFIGRHKQPRTGKVA